MAGHLILVTDDLENVQVKIYKNSHFESMNIPKKNFQRQISLMAIGNKKLEGGSNSAISLLRTLIPTILSSFHLFQVECCGCLRLLNIFKSVL